MSKHIAPVTEEIFGCHILVINSTCTDKRNIIKKFCSISHVCVTSNVKISGFSYKDILEKLRYSFTYSKPQVSGQLHP
jgi:hypothetical protein